jgi:hypothetical protein
MHKGFSIIAVLIIVLAIVAAGIAYVVLSKTGQAPVTATPAVSPTTVQESAAPSSTVAATTTSALPSSNPDIARVKAIIKDIGQNVLNGNNRILLKYASAKSMSELSGADLSSDPPISYAVNSVVLSGATIVANITTVFKGETPITTDSVFIKEGGDWKYDIDATQQLEVDQNNATINAGNANGAADLVVTGITVSPNRPLVNSGDVAIAITVKNNGTKAAVEVPLVASLTGFAGETPYQLVDTTPLVPGATVTETFYPYAKNAFFKISDTPGQKTIQITLNKDHKIVESNYDNDLFTQEVQMFGN